MTTAGVQQPSAVGAADYRAWKAWDESDFGRYSASDAVTFRRELGIAGIGLSGPIRLLELGFGNGQFLAWAKAQGWSVAGTELDEELVARAKAAGIEAHGAGTPIDAIAAGQPFDAIVAFDVFEHLTVDELLALLAAARRCLGARGRIVARFPSGDSPFGRSVQHSDLTHRVALGSGAVQQIARRAGFRVVQIRAPAFPVFGMGLVTALRRIAMLSLRNLASIAINLAFHDGQKLVITRNMVVVLEPE